jgi:hypothetical protein
LLAKANAMYLDKMDLIKYGEELGKNFGGGGEG